MSPERENLFTTLKKVLADFRAQVEGTPGLQVRELRTASGTLPDLARKVLHALAEALASLAGALQGAEDALRVADALMALLEVATQLTGALAAGLDFGELPVKFEWDSRPFQTAVEAGMRLAGHVPAPTEPTELTDIRQELEKLLGRRANPSRTDEGALGQLLADLTPRPP